MKLIQRLTAFFLTAAVFLGLAGYAAPVSYAHSQTKEQGSDLKQPFDIVNAELFEAGAAAYDQSSLLLKLPAEADGEVSKAMAEVGVTKLIKLFDVSNAAWFEAELAEDAHIHSAVAALRTMDDILMVDYNYYATTSAMAAPKNLPAELLGNPKANEQWYLEYCGIPDGMNAMSTAGGSSDVIVAVIDTGVDIDHEDLSNNIWHNPNEIPDNGLDDDGNGYIDDVCGVNIISGTGSGDDDNGHGTHVAGIIAAENNSIGVVGIAYNVQIMPIKACSASGVFTQSDIAQAVLYAYSNGAHVINMSFGSTACSTALQDALSIAYRECVLVASAGNDSAANDGGDHPLPNYPAALSYVLGVMSVNHEGVESRFTNYDAEAFNAVEYELYAPGENILSTIPNNGYDSWSGTSMAAPMVSAMAALMRSQYTDTTRYSAQFICGQLVSTSENAAQCNADHPLHNLPSIVNLHRALTCIPKPNVHMGSHGYFDTAGMTNDKGSNNGDGVIDAGEVIALGLTLRNNQGLSHDTKVSISLAGMSDPYVSIMNDTVNYGAIGTYSEGDCGKVMDNSMFVGWNNPFYIHIAEDCPNNYGFTLNITINCRNGMDNADTQTYTSNGSITLRVRAGVILPSIIDRDMTLVSDKLYIIPDETLIELGTTVTVEPGAHIQFWSDDAGDPYAQPGNAMLTVKGILQVEGTMENPVYIYPCDTMSNKIVHIDENSCGRIYFRYADVTNLGGPWDAITMTEAEHCRFHYNDGFKAQYFPSIQYAVDCIFEDLDIISRGIGGYYERCAFVDCTFRKHPSTFCAADCLFLTNRDGVNTTIPRRMDADYGISFVSQAYRGETDTTYFDCSSYVSGGNELRLYAMLAGGDILAVETQAELDWLKSNLLSPYAQVYLGQTHRFYLEIPGQHTIEEIDARFRQFHEEYYNTFTGNAIINPLLTNFSPSAWVKVNAPTGKVNTADISGNYWGTTNTELIDMQTVDYWDMPTTLGYLTYEPYLTTAPENTFPFVTDVTVLNEDGDPVTSVSLEEITVQVTFNRDMDTSIPLLVTYGPTEPYTQKTINGQYVNARTWEGTALVSSQLEGGNQYFRIANGSCAEDNLALCTDTARFTFAIQQSGIQSLELQAQAQREGIKLSWTQSDFDTMMGYNVYRSTSENGTYERINQTVIPANTTEFMDFDVTAPSTYYYQFAVVKTDLSESDPSQSVSATMHSYTSRVTKQPNCTEAGIMTYTCISCGFSFTEDHGEPLGHEYGDWYVFSEPTDEADGENRRDCNRCDEFDSKTVPMLSHNHSYNAVTTPPTCTEDGFTTHTCACGDQYVADETAPLGHLFLRGSCTRCSEQAPPDTPAIPFSDIAESDWFCNPVLWAVQNSITGGLTPTSFGPAQTCTRAQVVTFLYAAAGKPAVEAADNPFTDVSETDWFYAPVMWAVQNGITGGLTPTTFGPANTCTRAQVVTFLWANATK